MNQIQRLLNWWPGLAGALSFYCIGLLFFRYPGFQNDELLFAGTIFTRAAAVYSLPVGRGLPLMNMSYMGTLKTWVFGPLLRYRVSEATVRLPVVFLGAVTILLTYLLVTRMHSRRAAIVTTCLLATDATFLLTTCFDWGPVAFQHLFLVTGLLLVAVFCESARRGALFFAFFAFGLGLWDKALFLWVLSGTAVAALLIYPRELLRRLSGANLASASLGLLLGAGPLVVYNIVKPLETFHSNSHFVFNEFRGKWNVLRATFGGEALHGYLTNLDTAPGPRAPATPLENLAFHLHALTGAHPVGYEGPAMLAGLLLLPFLMFTRARRVVLFVLIAAVVAWLQMAITQGAGGAVHHTILLWPLPLIFLGIAFAQASLAAGRAGPWLLAVVTMAVAAGNLVSLNEYLYEFIRNGPAGVWTDAISPLADQVLDSRPSRVVVYDWGISNPLTVIHKGRIQPQWGDDPMFPPALDEAERKFRMEKLGDPGAVWVGHTDGNEQFSGINARVIESARPLGFEKEMLSIVADSHGHPMFQVFRWRRKP